MNTIAWQKATVIAALTVAMATSFSMESRAYAQSDTQEVSIVIHSSTNESAASIKSGRNRLRYLP